MNRRRRSSLYILFVLMLFSGVSELLSVGAVLPFLYVLSEPDVFRETQVAHIIMGILGDSSSEILLLSVIALFTLIVAFASFIQILNLWLSGRLAAGIGSDLSCEVYSRSLHQPYNVQVKRNSSELIACSTSQVSRTVVAISAFLQLIASTISAIGLFTGLILVNKNVALMLALAFGIAYGCLALTARQKLSRNSKNIVSASKQQIKILQEGLGSIRDVILAGNQNAFVRIYRKADIRQRQLQAENQFLVRFPRYAIESVGLIVMAIAAGALIIYNRNSSSVIPLLGTLALGSQRMLPALQQLYRGWSSLKGYSSDLEGVLAMLDQDDPSRNSFKGTFSLDHSFQLVNASFSYSKNQPKIITDLSIQISRGECIGLVGKTGSGKSTLFDILMGLLEPSSGQLIVDGIDLHNPANIDSLIGWRSSIAHVPQSIYLSDSTIAENIAFGVERSLIDNQLLNNAASMAQILPFIQDCQDGFETRVGERGVRLSGGQRQRIGIARALYRRCNILFLDEATSALDDNTEDQLMSSIYSLTSRVTIVMIAHRLSTLRRCDRIIRISNGTVRD